MESVHKYKVCIRCVTYNHVLFIKDTMESFTMQETHFPFIATIVDDASTDNNQEVILSFLNESFTLLSEKHDDHARYYFAQHRSNIECFFAVILLTENHYQRKQSKVPYFNTYAKDSQYIAICEGDDYWIDPLKLQKQADYLDENVDCCMVSCATWWMDKAGKMQLKTASEYERNLTTEEVILGGGGFLSTCSLMMRSQLAFDVPEWRRIANVGDYPLQIQGTLMGNLHFSPDIMCVYRFNRPGSWTETFLKTDKKRTVFHRLAEIHWMKELDNATNHKYQSAIYRHLLPYYPSLYLNKLIPTSDYVRAVICFGKKIDYKRMIKSIIKRIIHYKEV